MIHTRKNTLQTHR